MSNEQRKSNTKKSNKSSRRKLKYYLVDLFVKSLLIASLLAIDFSLFLKAGSYSAFDINQSLKPEACWVYIFIVAISFIITFLCSFSQTLQNILIGTAVSFLLLAILNQFALFSTDAIIFSHLPHIDGFWGDVISNYSHLIIAVVITFIIAVILTYMQRKTQFYLLIITGLICLITMVDAYVSPATRTFVEKEYLNDESTHPDSHNIVYIGLNNATTYRNLKDLDAKNTKPEIKQAADNILGFYQKNNFIYYPNSYIKYIDQPYLNLAATLNAGTGTSLEENLLSDIVSSGYWDFNTIKEEKIYLSHNDFFNKYHKKDYNLRVYQHTGIELCTINNKIAVNRCVERVGLPINFDLTYLSLEAKISLLAAQWLESSGIVPNIDPILGLVSAFNRNVVPFHFSTKNLGSYNAFVSLDRIADDIVVDKGNNLYFMTLDIPGDLYVYDNLCSIKPVRDWIDREDKKISQIEKYAAFAEQTSCLYGQLENFIQKLNKEGKLKQTTIIIQGLNAAFASLPAAEKDLLKNIQKNKQAGFAVFTPNNNKAHINNRLCLASSLLGDFIKSADECDELEDLSLTDKLKKEISEQNKALEINTQEITDAVSSFKNWYKSWAAQNQVINNIDNTIPIIKAPTTENEIAKVIAAEAIEEVQPETSIKDVETPHKEEIKEDMATENINTTTDKVTETKTDDAFDPDKPEKLKQQFKKQHSADFIPTNQSSSASVNIEVKVLDNAIQN